MGHAWSKNPLPHSSSHYSPFSNCLQPDPMVRDAWCRASMKNNTQVGPTAPLPIWCLFLEAEKQQEVCSSIKLILFVTCYVLTVESIGTQRQDHDSWPKGGHSLCRTRGEGWKWLRKMEMEKNADPIEQQGLESSSSKLNMTQSCSQ